MQNISHKLFNEKLVIYQLINVTFYKLWVNYYLEIVIKGHLNYLEINFPLIYYYLLYSVIIYLDYLVLFFWVLSGLS